MVAFGSRVWVAPLALLVAGGCRTSAPYAFPAAAINTSAALAASAQQRAAGGCYAACVYGTECNPLTGFCEPTPCGKCPDGTRCAASSDGFRCSSEAAARVPATLQTRPPLSGGIVPGVGFSVQPGGPPPSPQDRSDARVH